MGAHEFSMSVHDLDAAGRRFTFPVRPSWLRGALEGTNVSAAETEGELDVRLSKSGTDVVVHGTLKAELQVPCARCLEPARVAVEEPMSALAVPGAVGSGQRKGEDDEEADASPEVGDLIPYDGETVVLDDLVRDELLLAIPMIPLCSESCPGIRPEISPDSPAAGGVDPRFRALLRLKRTL